jgi:hypothetical protein
MRVLHPIIACAAKNEFGMKSEEKRSNGVKVKTVYMNVEGLVSPLQKISSKVIIKISMNKYISSGTALLVGLTLAGSASALTTVSSTLDFGATGGDVTALQQFLATDATIYPEGLVTGYFGSLTMAAVQRFQCKQSIVCSGDASSTGYGRVGPRTLAAINAAIGGGVVVSGGGDVSAPAISNVIVTKTQTGATVTWSTNESARGVLYYSTSMPGIVEATDSSGAILAGTAVNESTLGFNHSLSITGLQRNTWYYYVIGSTDASGNVQYTWPTSFQTTQ